MSHIATVNIDIKDLDCLALAALALGGELMRGQQTFKWYGRWLNDYHADEAAVTQGYDPADFGKCHHAIRLPGKRDAYEVGVVARRDGKPGYTLLYDNWRQGYGLETAFGRGLDKLTQEYALQVAEKQVRRQGYRVKRVVQQDGSVLLTCTNGR